MLAYPMDIGRDRCRCSFREHSNVPAPVLFRPPLPAMTLRARIVFAAPTSQVRGESGTVLGADKAPIECEPARSTPPSGVVTGTVLMNAFGRGKPQACPVDEQVSRSTGTSRRTARDRYRFDQIAAPAMVGG